VRSAATAEAPSDGSESEAAPTGTLARALDAALLWQLPGEIARSMTTLEQTLQLGTQPVALRILLLQLGVGLLMALIVRWHYTRFGSVLSNRDEFGLVFPLILLTTLLVITVVKSSLALSLGLVGALSIVRFRTPVKEPEELAYLFLVIGIGLGLGANQIAATVLATAFALAVMGTIKWVRQRVQPRNLYLSLGLQGQRQGGPPLETLNGIVAEHAGATDLRRFESTGERAELVYFVTLPDAGGLARLTDALVQRFPEIEVTFIDQPRVPGL
jgi:hypothetical protein